MKKVDVMIPVYKPTKELFTLLDLLEAQTLKPEHILLVNTEQKYFDNLVAGTNFWHKYKNVNVRHISKREFDHGYTRRRIANESDADYFVMMTDDAIPTDEHLLEKLLAPLLSGEVAMSYARQLVKEQAGLLESYTRTFNYPDQSEIKGKEDLKTRGIKAFFASDVCAAYDKKVYEKLGGFVKHTIFNEDMIYARGLIDAGYRIAYVADACVYHSHNYSGFEQLQRNFDLGVSHAQYPKIFSDVKSESEGKKLVKQTSLYLLKQKRPLLIVKLIWQSGCKYIGYFLGKRYRKIPMSLVKKLSMNKSYWDRSYTKLT